MASSSTITTKSHQKKNQKLQHCHEFPNVFFFVFNASWGGGINAYYNAWH